MEIKIENKTITKTEIAIIDVSGKKYTIVDNYDGELLIMSTTTMSSNILVKPRADNTLILKQETK